MKKAFVDFLVKYYTGTIQWKIGRIYFSAYKPFLLIFMLIFGATKAWEHYIYGYVEMNWWTIMMLILLVPQVMAGFSMWAVNMQKKLNNNSK